MKLHELLKNVRVLETSLDLNMEIGLVTSDSRQVTPGSLFVALKGFAFDGNSFIPMAMEKGSGHCDRPEAPAGYSLYPGGF